MTAVLAVYVLDEFFVNVSMQKESRMSDLFSVGLMNQVGDALQNAGYTPDDLTKFRSSTDRLVEFRKVLFGHAEIKLIRHIVDLDVAPFIPNGLRIEEKDQLPGRVRGKMELDSAKVNLYLSEGQKPGEYVVGTKLKVELENQPVYPAPLLDYYLAHPELIPESWKGKATFFWGTIYRDADVNLCVRCLYFSDESWDSSYYWLGDRFYSSDPAAVAGK